jgi:hypothetical protein
MAAVAQGASGLAPWSGETGPASPLLESSGAGAPALSVNISGGGSGLSMSAAAVLARRATRAVRASRLLLTVVIVAGWIATAFALGLIAWVADGGASPLAVYFYNCFTVRHSGSGRGAPTSLAPHTCMHRPSPT